MLRLLIAIVACALPLAAGAATSTPRLLFVQKDGHVAFMLPETHIGTPRQRDSYFASTIQPAFKASSMLLLEKGDTSHRDAEYAAKACQHEGADEAALDTALDAAIARHPATRAMRIKYTPQKLTTTSRFYRFDLLLRGLLNMSPDMVDRAADAGPELRLLPSMSSRLMQAAPRPWRSLDSLAANFDAYCALSSADRVVLLSHYIDLAKVVAEPPSSASQQKQIDEVYSQTDALDQSSLTAIAATLDGTRATPPPSNNERSRVRNTFMLVARNRGWMAQLPALFAARELPFFAIGAGHFVDGNDGPGLITMLREAGYTVVQVRDAAHLRTLLAGRPSVARVPRARGEQHDK